MAPKFRSIRQLSDHYVGKVDQSILSLPQGSRASTPRPASSIDATSYPSNSKAPPAQWRLLERWACGDPRMLQDRPNATDLAKAQIAAIRRRSSSSLRIECPPATPQQARPSGRVSFQPEASREIPRSSPVEKNEQAETPITPIGIAPSDAACPIESARFRATGLIGVSQRSSRPARSALDAESGFNAARADLLAPVWAKMLGKAEALPNLKDANDNAIRARAVAHLCMQIGALAARAMLLACGQLAAPAIIGAACIKKEAPAILAGQK